MTLQDRVDYGVDILNQYFGGPEDWVPRVDPESLDITSGSRCVLGQVFEDMNQSLEPVDGEWDELDADITVWDSELGSVLSVECNQCGRDLTELDPLRAKALELVDAKPWPAWRFS